MVLKIFKNDVMFVLDSLKMYIIEELDTNVVNIFLQISSNRTRNYLIKVTFVTLDMHIDYLL